MTKFWHSLMFPINAKLNHNVISLQLTSISILTLLNDQWIMIGDTGNSSCLMFSHEVLVFSGLYFAKHNHLNYIFLPYYSWLCFYFNF